MCRLCEQFQLQDTAVLLGSEPAANQHILLDRKVAHNFSECMHRGCALLSGLSSACISIVLSATVQALTKSSFNSLLLSLFKKDSVAQLVQK